MTEPLPDRWTTRDYPVLREVARRIDKGDHTPTVEAVAEALQMPEEDVVRAGVALERRGLVTVRAAWGSPVLGFTDISGQAYLLTGLHPDGEDAVSRLINALRQARSRPATSRSAGSCARLPSSSVG